MDVRHRRLGKYVTITLLTGFAFGIAVYFLTKRKQEPVENLNCQDGGEIIDESKSVTVEESEDEISSLSDPYVSASSILSSCSSLVELSPELSSCESSDECYDAKVRNICGMNLADSDFHLNDNSLSLSDLLGSPVVTKYPENHTLSLEAFTLTPSLTEQIGNLHTDRSRDSPRPGPQVITKYSDSLQQTIDNYHDIIKPNSPLTFQYIMKP